MYGVHIHAWYTSTEAITSKDLTKYKALRACAHTCIYAHSAYDMSSMTYHNILTYDNVV